MFFTDNFFLNNFSRGQPNDGLAFMIGFQVYQTQFLNDTLRWYLALLSLLSLFSFVYELLVAVS